MTSSTRKMFESEWLWLYSDPLWASIDQSQIGFRPDSIMGKNTTTLINKIKSGNYSQIWFIDFAAAFPSVLLSTCLDEINRRRELFQAIGRVQQ